GASRPRRHGGFQRAGGPSVPVAALAQRRHPTETARSPPGGSRLPGVGGAPVRRPPPFRAGPRAQHSPAPRTSVPLLAAPTRARIHRLRRSPSRLGSACHRLVAAATRVRRDLPNRHARADRLARHAGPPDTRSGGKAAVSSGLPRETKTRRVA